MEVPGNRRRGRPKHRRKDKLRVDMLEKNPLEHKCGIDINGRD